jgi:hypothetical protein
MKLAITIGLLSILLAVALAAGHALSYEGLQAPSSHALPASIF